MSSSAGMNAASAAVSVAAPAEVQVSPVARATRTARRGGSHNPTDPPDDDVPTSAWTENPLERRIWTQYSDESDSDDGVAEQSEAGTTE